MTICREWSLVKHLPESRHVKPLYCRSWGCDICRPKRKSQLLALASSGEPNRFLTLTVNPAVGDDPEHRLRMLTHAWKVLVKRLRRTHGQHAINYLAVVESTKAGEPHLHILLRTPFIAQADISAAMSELIQAPIVDIRRIRNQREVVRYVAKYITKAPHQFGGAKRYWQTPAYELGKLPKLAPLPPGSPRWLVDMRPVLQIVTEWTYEGWAPRADKEDRIIGLWVGEGAAPESPPPYALWTPTTSTPVPRPSQTGLRAGQPSLAL